MRSWANDAHAVGPRERGADARGPPLPDLGELLELGFDDVFVRVVGRGGLRLVRQRAVEQHRAVLGEHAAVGLSRDDVGHLRRRGDRGQELVAAREAVHLGDEVGMHAVLARVDVGSRQRLQPVLAELVDDRLPIKLDRRRLAALDERRAVGLRARLHRGERLIHRLAHAPRW